MLRSDLWSLASETGLSEDTSHANDSFALLEEPVVARTQPPFASLGKTVQLLFQKAVELECLCSDIERQQRDIYLQQIALLNQV